jgi:hypothetical protein
MLRSEFRCGTTTVQGSSVFGISSEGEWIEVRGTVVGGNSTVRVVRYRPTGRALERLASGTDSMPYAIVQEPALARYHRQAAGEQVGPAAVLDVVRHVETPVAEAWLNELRQGFALNANELVQLADAGMPPHVIDLMVALTYPQRFAVQRAEFDRSGAGGGAGGGMTGMMNRPYSGMTGYPYDRYCGYGYQATMYGYYDIMCNTGYNGYGMSPYYGYGRGYGYDVYYGGYYYGGSPLVIVTGTSNAASHGRAVNGAGYTRGGDGSSSAGTAQRTGSSGSASSSSGSSSGSSGSSASSGSASSGSASSGSASSGSSSSGSSGGDRTAKPRPPL